MRVTLKDIAARANVSTQAVSAALRDSPSTTRLSAPVRERILSTAREMGYQPNLLARALVGGRSGLFVISTDNLGDPHFAGTVLAVEREVRAAGFTLAVLRPERENPRADRLLYEMADAVLHLLPASRVEGAMSETKGLAPSIVVALPHQPDRPVPQYYWDEADGARAIADHLVELEHRAAAILAGGRTDAAGGVPERVRLLAEALESRGIQAVPIWDDTETDPVRLGSAGLVRAVTEHPGVTAVIGRNDRFTVGAYLECLRRGIAIPERISLISFLDTPLLAMIAPNVTAVRAPLRDAAVEAARDLIRHLREGVPLARSRQWRPMLVARSSTMPPEQ